MLSLNPPAPAPPISTWSNSHGFGVRHEHLPHLEQADKYLEDAKAALANAMVAQNAK
jgi:hypothetical protein